MLTDPNTQEAHEREHQRDYFPKCTDLAVHTAADLQRVSDDLNRRPRKTLVWNTAQDLLATSREPCSDDRWNPLSNSEGIR